MFGLLLVLLFVGETVQKVKEIVYDADADLEEAFEDEEAQCNVDTDEGCSVKQMLNKYLWNQTAMNLTPKGVDTARYIFQQIDKDGSQDWDIDEVNSYGQTTNGKPFEDDEVEYFLSEYATNKNGHLNLVGFIHFFATQTVSIPEESANDLSKFGFDVKLRYYNTKIQLLHWKRKDTGQHLRGVRMG